MEKLSVVGGIVTFNPDIARLRENLQASVGQLESLVVVDNNSTNLSDIEAIAREFPAVIVLANRSNGGMAKALNQIMSWAATIRASHVLLLDQDSVIGNSMVAELRAHVGPGVGIVCPAVLDRSAMDETIDRGLPSEVNYCITSGSLCSVDAWAFVGGYDDGLFIDFVDFDFCLRLRHCDFRIIREPKSTLLHEIGKITRHGPLTAYHHSAFRSYHMARDMIFYSYKNRASRRELLVQRRGLAGTYAILLRKALIVALFEEDRLHRVTSLIRGMISGTFALRRVE